MANFGNSPGLNGGSDNTAVGYAALENAAYGGTNNTAVGSLAMVGISGACQGFENTAIGYAAGSCIQGARRNTLIGSRAGSGICSISSCINTIIGSESGRITEGSNGLVIVGADNLLNQAVAGQCSIYIGVGVRASTTPITNEIVIGTALTGKGTNTTFIGGSSGAFNQCNTSTWNTTSDRRIKKEIVDNVTGLDVVESIRVRDFKYKTDEEMPVDDNNTKLATGLPQNKTVTGVIAQELQEVLPTAINQLENGVLTVNTDPILWALVNAVKELSAEVKELKRRLDER
jgi:hypothetical protein